MSEWDPERENYEPESDFRRDYLTPGLGQADRTPGRRRSDYERGVWSIGGTPREQTQGGDHEAGPPAAGAHAGKGPRGYCRGDVRIYDEVCDRLERDGDVDASDIEVTVKDGQVMLSGTVCDEEARSHTEDLVASCAGVREIRNRLRVPAAPAR
jgi:hypothetical protein